MASQFSAFAPSGIRFTRRKPHAERIYETMRESWGTLFTDDPEAAVNIETFATAKCLGIAKEMLERAGNQANPRHVTDLLPKLERDYRISPRPGSTIQERRAALIAARAVKGGARLGAIHDGLTALLGDRLLALVPQPMGAVGTGGMYPDTLVPNGGPGAFKPLGASFKAVRLTTHSLGTSVGYEYVAGDVGQLIVGERLTVDPSGIGLIETVTITAATASTFAATFTNPHSAGTMATTASIPYWPTGRRFLYVVAEYTVFDDAVLLAAVDDYLRKTLGHATCWALVSESGTPGAAGPFVIELSLLGQTPIVQVTY